ncbi:hypothetical protein BGZ54_000953 [Gamsiella multidivaricata]|nr:hypothetical protein BGZ54_000953 [Gamsiella multidivaricata]
MPGDGIESIRSIKTKLSPLRGQGDSFTNHVVELEKVEELLQEFYNGNIRFKMHKWDARRAGDTEYSLIAESLLGRKRDGTSKVWIGVGLGKFSAKTRLSSLHESFQSYFVTIKQVVYADLPGHLDTSRLE